MRFPRDSTIRKAEINAGAGNRIAAGIRDPHSQEVGKLLCHPRTPRKIRIDNLDVRWFPFWRERESLTAAGTHNDKTNDHRKRQQPGSNHHGS
jgi:hypothetical protein